MSEPVRGKIFNIVGHDVDALVKFINEIVIEDANIINLNTTYDGRGNLGATLLFKKHPDVAEDHPLLVEDSERY